MCILGKNKEVEGRRPPPLRQLHCRVRSEKIPDAEVIVDETSIIQESERDACDQDIVEEGETQVVDECTSQIDAEADTKNIHSKKELREDITIENNDYPSEMNPFCDDLDESTSYVHEFEMLPESNVRDLVDDGMKDDIVKEEEKDDYPPYLNPFEEDYDVIVKQLLAKDEKKNEDISPDESVKDEVSNIDHERKKQIDAGFQKEISCETTLIDKEPPHLQSSPNESVAPCEAEHSSKFSHDNRQHVVVKIPFSIEGSDVGSLSAFEEEPEIGTIAQRNGISEPEKVLECESDENVNNTISLCEKSKQADIISSGVCSESSKKIIPKRKAPLPPISSKRDLIVPWIPDFTAPFPDDDDEDEDIDVKNPFPCDDSNSVKQEQIYIPRLRKKNLPRNLAKSDKGEIKTTSKISVKRTFNQTSEKSLFVPSKPPVPFKQPQILDEKVSVKPLCQQQKLNETLPKISTVIPVRKAPPPPVVQKEKSKENIKELQKTSNEKKSDVKRRNNKQPAAIIHSSTTTITNESTAVKVQQTVNCVPENSCDSNVKKEKTKKEKKKGLRGLLKRLRPKK